MFADDGSPSARVAASVLEVLPLPPTTPISVLTVTDEAFPYDTAMCRALYNNAMALRQESKDQAHQEAPHSRPPPQPGSSSSATAPHLRCADPAHEILAYARQQRTGMLVLGTRGHTGLRRLRSVARNVLTHAPCSVLIVRETVVPPTNGEALIEQMVGRDSRVGSVAAARAMGELRKHGHDATSRRRPDDHADRPAFHWAAAAAREARESGDPYAVIRRYRRATNFSRPPRST